MSAPDPMLEQPPEPSKVAQARSARKAREAMQGIPLWIPLAALLIALAFAAFVAFRIIPSLSALVSPPDPVLPSDAVLQSHESNGTEDQWLYSSKMAGCAIAHIYAKTWGKCIYAPSSGCTGNDATPSGPSRSPAGGGSQVGECSGSQTVANLNIQWRVYISEMSSTDQPTIFRIYREIN